MCRKSGSSDSCPAQAGTGISARFGHERRERHSSLQARKVYVCVSFAAIECCMNRVCVSFAAIGFVRLSPGETLCECLYASKHCSFDSCVRQIRRALELTSRRTPNTIKPSTANPVAPVPPVRFFFPPIFSP